MKLSKDPPPKKKITIEILKDFKSRDLIWNTKHDLTVGIQWVGVASLQTEVWTRNGRNTEHELQFPGPLRAWKKNSERVSKSSARHLKSLHND
jgi:hypothetical protein